MPLPAISTSRHHVAPRDSVATSPVKSLPQPPMQPIAMASTPEQLNALRRSLPFLPGYQFGYIKRPNFRKSHAFDYSNDVPVFKEERPGIGGAPLIGQDQKKITTSADLLKKLMPSTAGTADTTESVPAWIAFDRKVLRFYAYFQEAVQERRDEQYRIRKVNILYYLEDDTLHVIEPRGVNSGIPQGTLIRRHRIPVPNNDPHHRQYYLFSDLSVGQEITFYARTFKITGCDAFTRDFLANLGLSVPANEDLPNDPYEETRREILSRMRPTRPVPPKTALKKFLEWDRKVLRFYCVWDDTTSAFGDARKLVLHYFLADDTIEIHEYIAANSGRDGNTAFLKRGKLPKRIRIGPSQAKEPKKDEFYTDRDLVIGAVLNVYGRPFLLCDCDEFTKEYYAELSLDWLRRHLPRTSQNARICVRQWCTGSRLVAIVAVHKPDHGLARTGASIFSPPTTHLAAYTPPEYNGWGSEEDSLGSCLSLTPKPPKKDMTKERQFGHTVLRFAGILNTHRQVDRERRFVISYHLADDTVSVFEPHVRNSGIVGGKWLERSKVKVGAGRYLGTQDLYVGAQVMLAGFPFVLIGADEHALRFMDVHSGMFPGHVVRTAVGGSAKWGWRRCTRGMVIVGKRMRRARGKW
ncbi:hypothetical protein BCR44DRAFT_1463879 [Catenaria anguillulae PL171]|uniref:DM10 domain-containing protein n=1 Tax=Catenaria anguillulae PL171 TaxID=765915 RepID=A0A1Y2H9T5_9FUNG|nr:hypothetical protein BCR44DRAFT_1463879 [Catenaria anguillulae PL171]